VVLAGVSWLWARTRIQQQDAQRRLLQAERLAAIGEAMAGLAHESRNTLQRSKGGLDLLARRVADRPEALELLTEVEQAQDHLHALYEEVRGYAAPLTLQRQEVDLRDLVHKAWGHLASRQSGCAELTIASSDVDWRCAVDPEAFVRVLRNVLENALDAGTPARIDIEASDARIGGRAAVRLSIRDHGSGMAPQARALLFEPFFTTKVRGTGLGLAICKRIVEAHGGLIALGEAAGPGTELVITLPRRGQ
jgi:hypothetical protein